MSLSATPLSDVTNVDKSAAASFFSPLKKSSSQSQIKQVSEFKTPSMMRAASKFATLGSRSAAKITSLLARASPAPKSQQSKSPEEHLKIILKGLAAADTEWEECKRVIHSVQELCRHSVTPHPLAPHISDVTTSLLRWSSSLRSGLVCAALPGLQDVLSCTSLSPYMSSSLKAIIELCLHKNGTDSLAAARDAAERVLAATYAQASSSAVTVKVLRILCKNASDNHSGIRSAVSSTLAGLLAHMSKNVLSTPDVSLVCRAIATLAEDGALETRTAAQRMMEQLWAKTEPAIMKSVLSLASGNAQGLDFKTAQVFMKHARKNGFSLESAGHSMPTSSSSAGVPGTPRSSLRMRTPSITSIAPADDASASDSRPASPSSFSRMSRTLPRFIAASPSVSKMQPAAPGSARKRVQNMTWTTGMFPPASPSLASASSFEGPLNVTSSPSKVQTLFASAAEETTSATSSSSKSLTGAIVDKLNSHIVSTSSSSSSESPASVHKRVREADEDQADEVSSVISDARVHKQARTSLDPVSKAASSLSAEAEEDADEAEEALDSIMIQKRLDFDEADADKEKSQQAEQEKQRLRKERVAAKHQQQHFMLKASSSSIQSPPLPPPRPAHEAVANLSALTSPSASHVVSISEANMPNSPPVLPTTSSYPTTAAAALSPVAAPLPLTIPDVPFSVPSPAASTYVVVPISSHFDSLSSAPRTMLTAKATVEELDRVVMQLKQAQADLPPAKKLDVNKSLGFDYRRLIVAYDPFLGIF